MKGTEDWLSQLKLRASWGQNGSTASLGGYKWNVSIGATAVSYTHLDVYKRQGVPSMVSIFPVAAE